MVESIEKIDFTDCSAEFEFLSKIIDAVGPRLPGSKEEKEAASMISSLLSEITGNEAHVEEFTFAPKASIGAIPVLGYLLLFVAIPLYVLHPLSAIVFMAIIMSLTSN